MAANVNPVEKVFHDPVHGQITLHPLLVKIIDTPEFQRLRSIKQLGGVSFVYPGGCHTRFEHSIGVAHLAGELASTLQSKQPELDITPQDILCVKIAGLCHDLGHGPFSHLYENIFKKEDDSNQTRKHENMSTDLFDHLVEQNSLSAEMEKYGLNTGGENDDLIFIKEMINPVQEGNQSGWPFKGRGEEKSFLYEIVANKLNGLDVDKFDYLERDCHHLGLRNTFDYRRFFLFSRVCKVDGRYHICVREKEVGNLYDMFYTRYSLHRRVYQHKVTKGVELMISDAFKEADDVLKLSKAIEPGNAEAYVKLTDGVFERILHFEKNDQKEEGKTEEEKEKIKEMNEKMNNAKKILQNIYDRKLYKCIGEAKLFVYQQNAVDQRREISREEINQLITELEEISDEGFEVVKIKYDFGKGVEDPLSQTYFYKKDTPDEASPIPQEERNILLPQHFCEKMFRIYWKNVEEGNTKLTELKEKFSTWYTEVQEH